MKILYKRVLLVLLVSAMLFSFAACEGELPADKHAIKIEEDSPYSEETLLYAEETILSLIRYAYSNAILNNISDKVGARLASYAHRLCDITAADPVSEKQYCRAIDMLAHSGEGVIDELISLRNGESEGYEKTRKLYLDLSAVFGADNVAAMLYDTCILIYDVCYERTVEKFETYQYPWYKDEAEALAAEKSDFAESIGKEDFSALVRCGTAIAELLSLDADEIAGAFSDAEFLEMIRHLELSEIRIDEKGWKILLSHSLAAKSSSYYDRLSAVFEESGDIDRVAAAMDQALGLIVGMIERCEPEDIALLRAGKSGEFLVSAFSRFERADWESFRSVSSVSLSNGKYSELALEEYGEDFSEYLAGIRQIEFDELRASVGSEDFYQFLRDYLAGICPAISYEVRV